MATRVIDCMIQFPAREGREKLAIKKVNEIETDCSYKNLTDRAKIILPRNVRFFDKKKVNDVFRRGDVVKIDFGYFPQIPNEFNGYVTEVSADYPITIRCEDEMWKLKQKKINFSAKSIDLKTLFQKLFPEYKQDVAPGIQLGEVKYSKISGGELLKDLQDKLIETYFKDGVLISGKIWSDDTDILPVKFNLERSIVSSSLNYRRKEDITVKVKGHFIKKGVKTEYEFGDHDAQTNINKTFLVSSKEELVKEVKRFYEKSKQDGFDGSFTAFGTPRVAHGMKADITSQLYPDRNGIYYIESVVKNLSASGIRQTIKLGNKAV